MHARPSKQSDPPHSDLAFPVYLHRLAAETDALAQSAQEMQRALAALPLATYPRDTRRALQSIDRLTQTLDSLSRLHTDLARSGGQLTPEAITAAVERVPMASPRARLLSDEDLSAHDETTPGEVDLF